MHAHSPRQSVALTRDSPTAECMQVSDETYSEAKRLLSYFGVPYVEAPTEAEAQCAQLEALHLVDGIVTGAPSTLIREWHADGMLMRRFTWWTASSQVRQARSFANGMRMAC